MAFLEVRNLGKTYVTRLGACRVQALKDVSFSVEKGEFIAVMGESGSGKTTLLNILAALDRPGSGDVLLEGKSLSGIAEKYAGFLPASFRASIVAACERSIGAVLADNAVVLADSIVENVLQPLLTPVITLVLFFLFYALLRLLVSMLVTVLGLVNKLPVVGTVNRGLGWLVGGGTALMDLYLVLCVVWGLVVITGGSLSVLNDTVMSGSLYYKVFNLFNPFL